jgi:hypothetical protein
MTTSQKMLDLKKYNSFFQKNSPTKLTPSSKMQPNTLTRRGHKDKSYVSILEKVHVGSETI